MSTEPRDIDPTDLPDSVARYLSAHRDDDTLAAVDTFADNAIVVDDGNIYTGADHIRAWLSRSATEFIVTVELSGAVRLDDQHYDAINHLEGNFPGGVVDLRFGFTLDAAGSITRLVIAPVEQTS